MEIKKVAVLGSGVMGSAIAAHLANAGIPSLLVDIVPPELSEADQKAGLTKDSPAFRNKFALNALQNVLPAQKPSPVFDKKVMKLITPANFEDHMKEIGDCDWVVEVVVERLDIKRKVYENLEKHIKPTTIISSNTSGIPLAQLIEGRTETFQKNFLITHFFNPVRYMKLLEIVSGEKTSQEVLDFMANFLESKLGKGIVYAKDTTNFIGNRIGIYGLFRVIHEAVNSGMSVEAVDKITGPATARPKSATFRTADLVGLDTAAHVAKNGYDVVDDESRDALKIPQIMQTLIENKWLGSKTGQGFYKKDKKDILSLDLQTGEYTPQEKVRYDCLGLVRNLETPAEKFKAVMTADDDAGKFAWVTGRDTLIYSANRIPEIADDVVNIDNAMKWGYNWELGPFEMLDAYGVKEFVERAEKDGVTVPQLIKDVVEKGTGTFYKYDNGVFKYFDVKTCDYKPVPRKNNQIFLKDLREQKKVIKSNAGASLIDLGDGVVNVEFHTKMNAIDSDIGNMVNEAIDLVESDDSYKGVVIANEANNFSVGANLMLIWMESTQQNWDNVDKLVREFQDCCMRMRYSKKPVVVATSGMALGGGCEVSMGADLVRAHGETYIGLVEVGAGLIPAGGGCKNMILNMEAMLKAKGAVGWAGRSDGGPFPKAQKSFETIGFAKVATSAMEAMKFGYLQPSTRISMSRDQLIFDAKNDVLELAKAYEQKQPRENILVAGEGGLMAVKAAIRDFQLKGLISDHDALIATKLAIVLTGGNLPHQGYVSEQDLLDLEREGFLSLCGEEKSQARMQNLVMTGKPLRN